MSAPQPQDIRIFISHSSADNTFGVRLAEDLRRVLGDPTAVWYDSAGGLRPGDSWWRTIMTEVSDRPIFLVIWSPDAKESRWVNDECDLAWQLRNGPRGKTIIPLIARKCDLRPDLELQQGVSFVDMDEYDKRFSDLLAALGLAAGPHATGAPAPTPTGGSVRTPADEVAPNTSAELLLLSIDGIWPATRVPMCGSTVAIGRESGNDVLVHDPAVSRFHLKLVRQRAGWQAEVLPNAKPMYVNGERRETALLGHGDQLVIGGTVLRVEQPQALANATTLNLTDSRTVLASGLVPDLVIEALQFRFVSPLRSEMMTIGRAAESAIVIPSPLVSSHQAVLKQAPDGSYEIEVAREARNHFTLDGRPVKRQILRNGDTLTLGSRAHHQYVALTYVAVGALPPAAQ